ncbi:MAG: hypothetical protein ACKPKO_13770, partial [Candidatus Fonsibacter sp.]
MENIYIGLLNKINDYKWKSRMESALARLRSKCNPIILLGFTAEALPCSWQSQRLLTEHPALDQQLDKFVHQVLYFDPAVPTTFTTGATNMTFL